MSEFDPTALSEIADILDEAGFVARAKHARAALDEIERPRKDIDSWVADRDSWIARYERQAKHIAELDGENAMHRTTIEAFKAQIIENSERIAELENPANVLYRLEKNLGEINADPLVVEAGKRIVELEEASAFECRDLYETIAKQRAALKILGKRSGKRGKALVKEVAARIAYENNMQLCECEEYAMCQARQQLRQEGSL